MAYLFNSDKGKHDLTKDIEDLKNYVDKQIENFDLTKDIEDLKKYVDTQIQNLRRDATNKYNELITLCNKLDDKIKK